MLLLAIALIEGSYSIWANQSYVFETPKSRHCIHNTGKPGNACIKSTVTIEKQKFGEVVDLRWPGGSSVHLSSSTLLG